MVFVCIRTDGDEMLKADGTGDCETLAEAATDLYGRARRKVQPTVGCYEAGYGMMLLVR